MLRYLRRTTNAARGHPLCFPTFVLLFLFGSKLVMLSAVANTDNETCDGYSTQIDVVNNNNKDCLQTSYYFWRCPNLESALELVMKLSSDINPSICIKIYRRKVEHLTKNYIFRQSGSKIKIFNRYPKEQVTIKCRNFDEGTSYGISFINNNKVELANLNFENCGGPHETYYRRNDDNQASQKLHKMNLTTVLNFENIKQNINIRNIRITDFQGYGIAMTDCAGEIHLSDLVLNTNTPVQCDFDNMKGIVNNQF